jgi:hypothetical protein
MERLHYGFHQSRAVYGRPLKVVAAQRVLEVDDKKKDMAPPPTSGQRQPTVTQ